jgi:hypothetical protein
MRHHLLTALCVAIALGGCSKKEEYSGSAPAAAMAPASAPRQAQEGHTPAKRTMAYEHSIQVDAAEDKIAAVYEAAQAACVAVAADGCVVLESNLSTGEYASASLKFRAKPEGIQKLVAALGSTGNVISKTTRAEDLASPLEDSAKQLAMLQDYRSKLEALRGRAGIDVDALIKVNKELAQVQSDIEAKAGERSHLVRRVETELLHVNINTTESRSFWMPISRALGRFSSNFSDGISSVIIGLAYLIPWGLTLLVMGWGVRKLWGRMKRRPPTA